MRIDKNEAILLRKAGTTYKDIQTKLGVPLSTLSSWFKNEAWSNEISIKSVRRASQAAQIRLVVMNTVRGTRLKKVYEEAKQDALVDYAELKFHPLFMAGVLLYDSRGEKCTRSRIAISSSDPLTIKIFGTFLSQVCGVANKIHIQILIPGDLTKEPDFKAYWSDKTGVNLSNFIKSAKIPQKKRRAEPYYGVCNIMVNSAYLKSKILKWIELLKRELSEDIYVKGPGSI